MPDSIKDDTSHISEDSIDNDDLTPDEECIDWIRSKIFIQGFNPYNDDQWTEEYEMTISDFLASPHITSLIIYKDLRDKPLHQPTDTNRSKDNTTGDDNNDSKTKRDNFTIVFDTSEFRKVPAKIKTECLQFFLKDENASLTKLNKCKENVQYGTVRGDKLESLLSMMNSIYLPTILANQSWPKSVRKDLCEKLHKFMAALTESVNHQRGKTVLYVPEEAIEHGLRVKAVKDLASDTELTRRLESTLIHWTRQIEEMVKNQAIGQQTNDEGPLEEIEFWRARTVDLVSVREQLNKTGVQNIITVLRKAGSTYLDRFDTLAGSIEKGSLEANDNLKFLIALENPCKKLSNSKPIEIPKMLPEIISIIRMIWETSQFYCTKDRLTGLLRKVSNQIILQCSKIIDLNAIYEGNVLEMINILKDSEACGNAWKVVYQNTAEIVQVKSQNMITN